MSRPAVPCSAHRSDGEPCPNYAMAGSTVCHAHGGRAPQVRDSARVKLLEARAQQAVNDMIDDLHRQGFDPAKAIAVRDPEGELLRVAGEVIAWKDWLAGQVAELRHYETTGAEGVEDVKALVRAYERAQDRAVATLSKISSLNLVERRVQLEEQQAQLYAGVFLAVLSRLGLDPGTVAQARELLATELEALEVGP